MLVPARLIIPMMLLGSQLLLFGVSRAIASGAPSSASSSAFEGKHKIIKALSLIPGSPFDGNADYQKEPSLAGQASDTLERMLTGMPEWLPGAGNRRAAEKMRQMIDPNAYPSFKGSAVGAGNDSMMQFQRRRLYQNPCFSELAARFYAEIGLLDSRARSCRPNLGQVCGDGPSGPLAPGSMKPGWLWDRALQLAGGDSGLAMALIGVCGHDDLAQGAISVQGPSAAEFPQELVLRVIDDTIEAFQRDMDAIPLQRADQREASESKLKSYRDFRSQVVEGKIRVRKPQGSVSCPNRTSLFYLPQSLGSDADVSQQVKDRVGRIQSPERGAAALPAKYYHVYGGALVACEGIQSGGHPAAVQEAAKKLAWAYRTVRMQDVLQSGLKGLAREEFDYGDLLARDGGPKSLEQWRKERSEPGVQSYLSGLSHLDPARLKQEEEKKRSQIEAVWIERDAAKIFDSMTVGTSIAGVSLHTNWRLPWQGDPVQQYLDEKSGKAPPAKAPKGWSDERFEKARLKALTYLMDWEWTVAQHEAGAAFAAKHCKPRGAGFNDLDDVACKLLPSSAGVNACASGGQDPGLVKAVDQLLPAVEAAGTVMPAQTPRALPESTLRGPARSPVAF